MCCSVSLHRITMSRLRTSSLCLSSQLPLVRGFFFSKIPPERMLSCSLFCSIFIHLHSGFLRCSQAGLHAISYAFPQVKIVTAAVDRAVNDKFHILPGIGAFFRPSPFISSLFCLLPFSALLLHLTRRQLRRSLLWNRGVVFMLSIFS
jgi:hypothetical protein